MFINGSYHYFTFFTANTGLECDNPFSKISGPHACQVKPNSKPWIISLHIKDKYMTSFACGGTLIGSKVVLTAAHCVCQCKIKGIFGNCLRMEVSPHCNRWKQMYVVAGDHNIEKYDKGEQKNIINGAKVHAKWDGN